MNPLSTITSIASLLFPSKCLACSSPIKNEGEEDKICIACREFLRARLITSTRGSLKLFAGSKYSKQMAHIVLAAKEYNQIEARKILASNLTLSLHHVSMQMAKNMKQNSRRILLIPIPSRKVSDRKRGFSHIQLLISEFQIRNVESNLQVLNCLSHTRRIQDQSTLNLNEREVNMRGAFFIQKTFYPQIRSAITSNTAMFLVDDLVTTGATVQAANSALLRLGARVDGVLASCATDGFTH
jgi:predicted amidophosphoribosyltransferase